MSIFFCAQHQELVFWGATWPLQMPQKHRVVGSSLPVAIILEVIF